MKLLCLLMLACAVPGARATELRDPMRPPQRPAAHGRTVVGVPVVSAVFTRATHPAAIVNGLLVHAGDRLGDYTIVALLEDGIRCRAHGVVSEHRLLAADLHIKKPVADAVRLANGGS